MATLAAPGASKAPTSPVPLDTLPISPDGSNSSGQDDNTAEQPSAPSKSSNNDDEIVTVLHDPDNFNVKHPLMHEWTLWFTKPPSGKVCKKLTVTWRERAR